jgi:hypothetical protein
MSYVLILIVSIDVVVVLLVWGAPTLLLYLSRQGYKESL